MTDITTASDFTVVTNDMHDYAKLLMEGIAQSRAATVVGSNMPILRLNKSGQWGFGPSNEDVQPGSHWAINIMSLQHGWCCWVDSGDANAKNSLEGELMVSMTKPKPAQPAPIKGTEWKEQRVFQLRCLDGEDEGAEVIYKAGSYGGMQAVDTLLGLIQRQLARDPAHPHPVVTLEAVFYQHNKWGKIANPVFNLTGFVDTSGASAATAAISPSSAPPMPRPVEPQPPEPPPAARARKQPIPATAATAPAVPWEEPAAKAAQQAKRATGAAAAAAYAGQRRRPAPRA